MRPARTLGNTINSREFEAELERRVPASILDAMSAKGWNVLGVMELAEEVKREFKKQGRAIVVGKRGR